MPARVRMPPRQLLFGKIREEAMGRSGAGTCPPGERAAQASHEPPFAASPYSITQSARANSDGESLNPMLVAVFKLMASS